MKPITIKHDLDTGKLTIETSNQMFVFALALAINHGTIELANDPNLNFVEKCALGYIQKEVIDNIHNPDTGLSMREELIKK